MAKNSITDAKGAAGYSLVDMLIVVGFITVICAIAVPLIGDVSRSIRLGEGARQVERVLQGARLKAVSTNRAFRVRFNCPVAGQYRMVELIGTPSLPAPEDIAPNRCSAIDYPSPPTDINPITKPNHDGPVNRLHPELSFSPAPITLEFWPDGSIHADQDGQLPWKPLSGTGRSITLVKGSESKTITVNGLGKIQLQ